MTHIILGASKRLARWNTRELNYELAVGDPVNLCVATADRAPVYEQRLVVSLTERRGKVYVEVSDAGEGDP